MKLVATHAIETQDTQSKFIKTWTSYSFILYKSDRTNKGSARSHAPEDPHDQEPASTNESDGAEDGDTVQHDTHVNGGALLLGLVGRLSCRSTNIYAIDTSSVEDDGSESEVAEHPGEDDSGSEPLVIVLVLLLRGNDPLGSFPLGCKSAKLGLVLGVEVCVVGRNCDIDFAAGFDVCGGQLLGFVVTFRTPCDVVSVAEGVDVEDVDVCRRQEEVLQEASGHVPRIEEENRGEKVE